MKLVSDFCEAYDYHFNNNGPIFRRVTTDGLNKPDQFTFLLNAGFSVPPHGLVEDVRNQWWGQEGIWVDNVVAYDDLNAHCGEGKTLLTRQTFHNLGGRQDTGRELYRLCKLFCSAYLGKYTHVRPSVSWRLLKIGPHTFWLEYRSFDDWRSNCGDVDIQVIDVKLNEGPHSTIKLPLFAIDFVIGKEMWAVDFNIAPGIRGTGVERYLSGKQIADALQVPLA